MNKLSIKVKISDREYPMKVDSVDEENIRRAGKIINERLRSYREKFGIDDKQDLLAMVAFDSTVEKLKAEGKSHQVDDTIEHKLAQLNQIISEAI
jgi:cell division protein ZapA